MSRGEVRPRTRPDTTLMWQIVRIGWPTSSQLVLRVLAVFMVVALAQRLYTTERDQSLSTALGLVLRLETMALYVSLGWGSAAQTFDAETVYEATPSLDTTAYVKARVKNGTGRPLLRGPTTIFVGGEFVGQGELQTTGPGGEIGFPLGADENVRLIRNVVPSTERKGVFSKDDVTTYAVELQVGNYKKIFL